MFLQAVKQLHTFAELFTFDSPLGRKCRQTLLLITSPFERSEEALLLYTQPPIS